ncbi:MAG: carbohydrate-binding family 9-like protein [Sandaracinaceae bacterium]|nr:carbohydrate-binding family 9-like protein [Myxococcales bacterium]MCB9662340.1 carbohydrate-binding family 9-like protein [Sandaracinaceae bacterium]
MGKTTHGAAPFVALGILGLMLSSACVERSEELSAAQRERVRTHVSRTAPHPSHPLDIAFGDSVELIGYDLSEETWARGTDLTVTWHWKVLAPVGDDYRLFTHIEARGTDTLNHDGDGAVRGLYPPSRWQAGEYIRDEQRIHLPSEWGMGPSGATATDAAFYVGFWRGNERLPVRRGAQDGDNRARPLTIPVSGGNPVEAGPPRMPELVASRALSSITVDGDLHDPGWLASPWSQPFVQTMNGAQARFEARARVVYDDTYLYVAFQVADTNLQSPHRNADDHLWEQDCVEVFLDPDGDGRNYFEIQVSPRGVVFDTRYDSRRQPQPFGHVNWQSQAQVGVALRGTLDDDQVDEGYHVELRVPFSALVAEGSAATQEAPAPGSTWRMNFYVMEKSPNGQDAAGWSPVLVPDFHATDRFGRVTFRDLPRNQRANPERPSVNATEAALEDRGRALQETAERVEAQNRPAPGEHPVAP